MITAVVVKFISKKIYQVGTLTHEKSIPEAILKEAKGLAILTIAKVGVMMTYKIGTGLVVACLKDGSWSPPSAISSFGIGWGAQVSELYLRRYEYHNRAFEYVLGYLLIVNPYKISFFLSLG